MYSGAVVLENVSSVLLWQICCIKITLWFQKQIKRSATNWKVHSVPHMDVLPQLINNQNQLNKINLNAMEVTGSNGKKFQAFLLA